MSSADFEPERYADEYRERALTMIEQKAKGQEIKAVAPAPRRTGQVVDIFAALKKSLEIAGPAASYRRERQAQKKSVGTENQRPRLLCSCLSIELAQN